MLNNKASRQRRKVTVYCIQFEHGGIPEEPDLFTDKAKAERFFLESFKEKVCGKRDFNTVDEAYEYQMNSAEHDGDNMLRWWTIRLGIPAERQRGKRHA